MTFNSSAKGWNAISERVQARLRRAVPRLHRPERAPFDCAQDKLRSRST